MNSEITFKLAYRIANLIDLNTKSSEIAASAGLPEYDVIEMEAWDRSLSVYSSELGHGTITITQAVVLRYIGRWKLTGPERQLIQPSGQPVIEDARAREIVASLKQGEQLHMAEAFRSPGPKGSRAGRGFSRSQGNHGGPHGSSLPGQPL